MKIETEIFREIFQEICLNQGKIKRRSIYFDTIIFSIIFSYLTEYLQL